MDGCHLSWHKIKSVSPHLFKPSNFFLFLRSYTGGADKSDFDSMSSVLLIYEMESKLRCTNDFKEIINHITTEYTIINGYLQKHVMLLPGDWGGVVQLKKN